MRRLLLINPVGRISGGLLSRVSTFQPLGLAYLAALTPSGWDVKINDENFGQLPVENADLVGITAFTSSVNRAYELAQQYRQRGIKVVMGGIHASMMPDEALGYSDAVVVGEAEGVWAKVISDFESGRMSGIYRGPQIDLGVRTVRPRRDLLDPRYVFHSVQTSRGCPFRCDFCSVTQYLGHTYRQRAPEDVLDELEQVPGRYVFFVDDNLVGYTAESRERARTLFDGMIRQGLRKRWWMQTSINSAEDESLLRLAGRSGCLFALIGFESIAEDQLKDMKKGINLRIGVDNYRRVIQSFHRAGIGVVGSFIIGNDHESVQYYRQIAGFLVSAGVDAVQLAILTPFPGSMLMERMKAEGRLTKTSFPQDWASYRLSYVVRSPLGVDADTIYRGDNYIKHHIYSFPRGQWRSLRSLFGIRNLVSYTAVHRFDRALKRSWKGAHYYGSYSNRLDGVAGKTES